MTAPPELSGFEADFGVRQHTKYHSTLHRPDLHIDCWRTRDGAYKWMAWGRTFEADPGAVLAAYNAGRLRRPADAERAECNRCGAEIWWVRTWPKGKPMPCNPDGGAHFKSCVENQDGER